MSYGSNGTDGGSLFDAGLAVPLRDREPRELGARANLHTKAQSHPCREAVASRKHRQRAVPVSIVSLQSSIILILQS